MLSDYDFRYTGIMKGPMESIPIGNGNLGANIWAEKDGIYFLLSKTCSSVNPFFKFSVAIFYLLELINFLQKCLVFIFDKLLSHSFHCTQ